MQVNYKNNKKFGKSTIFNKKIVQRSILRGFQDLNTSERK